MKFKNVKNLLPYNIQFFADNEDPDEEDNEDPDEEEDQDDESEEDESEPEDKKKKGKNGNRGKYEKTFSQRQVTAMMAKEKREGKKSVLKSLGFENEDEAKKAVSLFRALMDSQKTDEEKNNGASKKLEGEKKEAEKRAMLAEAKVDCLSNGVDKDSIEDVLAIALPKVTDDNTLENILKDMKKNKKYSVFFGTSNGGEDNEDEGTGAPPAHSRKNNNSKGGIGKRLAEATKVETKKSSYF